MTIIFKICTVYRDFFAFLHIFQNEKFAHLIARWKFIFFAIHIITNLKYLSKTTLANFWLHILKSGGYRKLANICKSMQIRKPVVQKNFFFKCLSIFLVKWVYQKLYICQFQMFDTNWPSLISSRKRTKDLAGWQPKIWQDDNQRSGITITKDLTGWGSKIWN